MTARSLTESGYDPKSWHAGYSEGNSHGFESRDAEVEDLRDSRERAIRWAVTLEGQNAQLTEAIRTVVADIAEWLKEGYGSEAQYYIEDAHTALVAALTGSTE